MCCCTFCILPIQKKYESTDEIMFLFLLPCFSLFSPVLTKNKSLQPGFVCGLTWGRSKASWDVRRPNGAVDDPLVTPECGQRPVESGVPLWVGNKNTWRSGERKRNWEETKIKKKKSTKTNRTHHFSGLIPRSRDDEVLSSGLTPVHRVHLQNTQSQYSIRMTTPTVVFFCERVACVRVLPPACVLWPLSAERRDWPCPTAAGCHPQPRWPWHARWFHSRICRRGRHSTPSWHTHNTCIIISTHKHGDYIHKCIKGMKEPKN